MNAKHITPVIIVKNGERHLRRTLDSFRQFDRVVVYDTGSTDSTEKIAQSFDNVAFFTGSFEGFGPTKNRAAELAETDWILSLDSDEALDDRLKEAILTADLSDTKRLFRVDRLNLFLGKPVRHSGWSPDRLVRLYHRGYTRFSDRLVHESVVVPSDAKLVDLPGKLIHHAVDEINDMLLKVARYSRLPRNKPKTLHPALIFARACFAFFRTYLLKRGFLDGYAGLVIAVSNFNGVFFKYMNQYIGQRHGD